MVLWLFVKNGRTSYFPSEQEEHMSREERWTKPADVSSMLVDKWSPS
jgi:hypothetical protein